MPILVEFHSLEENIKLFQELNLDFIELNLDIPYCFPENIETNLLNNNTFTIHLSEKFDVGVEPVYFLKFRINQLTLIPREAA